MNGLLTSDEPLEQEQIPNVVGKRGNSKPGSKRA